MDLSAVQSRDDVTNLQEAFDLAEKHLNVPKLLEPEGKSTIYLKVVRENLHKDKYSSGCSVGFSMLEIAFSSYQFRNQS